MSSLPWWHSRAVLCGRRMLLQRQSRWRLRNVGRGSAQRSARHHSTVAFVATIKENSNEHNCMPKTPEQWLADSVPKEKKKGTLKLFLGYAPGVGKTYGMLSEAIRRHSRGEDIVAGIIETHGRKGTAELGSQ